jgi:hypothetical protein
MYRKQTWKEFEKQIQKLKQDEQIVLGQKLNYEQRFVSKEVEIFDESDKITVNDFLETMMSDPGPQRLSWLLVLHRIANAESSRHSVACGSCGRNNFRGLRYKSERANYHLCQVWDQIRL